MNKSLVPLILLAGLTSAFAQSGAPVKQSGNITPNTVPWWITSGVIGGGITAADSPISSFGATGPICSNSARQASGAWNSLCFQANANSNATISLQNYGSASPQTISLVINGTSYPFPFSGAPIQSSDVAFLQLGTGAVERSVQNKLQGFISTSDYGVICNGTTDWTTKIQQAWNEAAKQDLDLFLDPSGATGDCIHHGLVMPVPTGGGILPSSGSNISMLRGPGSSQFVLRSAMTGTDCAITITVTYGLNSNLRGKMGGFSLIQPGTATGSGICLNGVTQAVIEDVGISYFNNGIKAIDTINLVIRNSTFYGSVIDIVGLLGAGSAPNAWHLSHNTHYLWQQHAIFLQSASDIIVDAACLFQSGGSNAALSPSTINAIGNPANGTKGFTVKDSYFENNQGLAEFLVSHTGGTTQGQHDFTGNNIIRLLTALTNIVAVNNVATGETTAININGNGFSDIGIPSSSGRQFIAVITPGNLNVSFNCVGGNTNNVAVEMNALCGPIAANQVATSDANGTFAGFGSTTWIGYTPVVTSQGGTPTSVFVTGKYIQTGKTVTVTISISVLTVGTATGQMLATLPFSAKTVAGSKYIGSSFESSVTSPSNGGVAVVLGDSSPTLMRIANVSASTYWVNSYVVTGQVTYEIP